MMTKTDMVTRAQEVHKAIVGRYKFHNNVQAPNRVEVAVQGNFTVVTLDNMHVGIAKRNNNDKYNFITGFNVALNRAMHRLLQPQK